MALNALFDVAAAELAERVARGIVFIRSAAGGGTGTIWSADGLIVTNHHVVPGDSAEIETFDGRTFAARVVNRDPDVDLALLKVPVDGLTPLPAGDSSAARTGELVFAMGNPWGQRNTVTAGIVLTTSAEAPENAVSLERAIRADVRLAPGNSGGPLVNARGEVIGINAMIAGGVAIAVPSNVVIEFAGRDEAGLPGFLGVEFQAVPLPQAIAASYRLPEAAGLMLTGIEPGSPAEAAGLLPGDILVGVDAERGLRAIGRRFERMRAGKALRLAVVRGGAPWEAQATPAVRA
jgi:serine protease Do